MVLPSSFTVCTPRLVAGLTAGRRYLVGLGWIWLAGTAVSVHAQTADFEQLKALELETLAAGAAAQQQIAQLDDQRASLANQYRNTLRQSADLDLYNQQLRDLIADQQEEAESLRRQIDNIGRLEQDMVPLMHDMLDTLQRFIALDLPFLRDEREQRLQKLRALMRNASVSNAEKFRRVLEAYQIENDYGRTIEAYDGTLHAGTPEQQAVTFLKVGRIALLYQTPDGAQSFRWNNDNGVWESLPARYNRQVGNGIKMAREQMTSDLLLMPVKAPQ